MPRHACRAARAVRARARSLRCTKGARSALACEPYAMLTSPAPRVLPLGPSAHASPAPAPFAFSQEGLVDDQTLGNPLQRLERLGTGWIGAVFDWEGVLVENWPDAHRQAWLLLAEEEDKRLPMAFELQRSDGMKAEQVISEVFCWARDPSEVRRLATRKHELVNALVVAEQQGGTEPDLTKISGTADGAHAQQLPEFRERPGARQLLGALSNAGVPVTIGCCAPRDEVERGLKQLGLEDFFQDQGIIAAEDVQYGKPDPECYLYAAQLLERPPLRCVVFGSDNRAIEAAKDAQMKTVAVSGTRPHYELASADTVVRELGELSVSNLKNLFSLEELRDPDEIEPEFELEPEVDEPWVQTTYADPEDPNGGGYWG